MTRTRVLIAPDKFKGCLTAAEVASAIGSGFPAERFEIIRMPLADGGDGSVAAALSAGAEPLALTVTGPTGLPVQTTVALSGPTAIIEIASICGLALLRGVLEPLRASSYGVGEAIRQVVERTQSKRVVLALGGSATTDGGAGMLAALGMRFIAADGTILTPCGGTLVSIDRIEAAELDILGDIELIAASDVRNPLLGPSGAAAVFGPQKGASPNDVDALERGLRRLVSALPERQRASAVAPGAGSAGGIGYACLVAGGRIVSGADFFLDLLGYDAQAARADLIITGEGSFDAQTEHGKLISAVTRRAGRSVIVVAGRASVSGGGMARLGVSAVHTLENLTHLPTANDPALSSELLGVIGRTIAAPD